MKTFPLIRRLSSAHFRRFSVAALTVWLFASIASAQEVTWTNGSGDGLASNPSNWSGTLTSSSTVRLDGTSTTNLVWDSAAPQSVAGWTQTSAYSGTVQFNTTHASYSADFTQFSITGNAMVSGGQWTHQAQEVALAANAERYLLNVSVGGNFTLASTGAIDVVAKGYLRVSGGSSRGGSHGGRGEDGTSSGTYGSILAPNLPGGGSGGGPEASTKTVAARWFFKSAEH